MNVKCKKRDILIFLQFEWDPKTWLKNYKM